MIRINTSLDIVETVKSVYVCVCVCAYAAVCVRVHVIHGSMTLDYHIYIYTRCITRSM